MWGGLGFDVLVARPTFLAGKEEEGGEKEEGNGGAVRVCASRVRVAYVSVSVHVCMGVRACAWVWECVGVCVSVWGGYVCVYV